MFRWKWPSRISSTEETTSIPQKASTTESDKSRAPTHRRWWKTSWNPSWPSVPLKQWLHVCGRMIILHLVYLTRTTGPAHDQLSSSHWALWQGVRYDISQKSIQQRPKYTEHCGHQNIYWLKHAGSYSNSKLHRLLLSQTVKEVSEPALSFGLHSRGWAVYINITRMTFRWHRSKLKYYIKSKSGNVTAARLSGAQFVFT